MNRVRFIVSRSWRSLLALSLAVVPAALAGSKELTIPAVHQPTVFSIAGVQYSKVQMVPANQVLPNARIQVEKIDTPDDALDTRVNDSIQQKTDAFIRALPTGPAVAGFYHQLRIVPHIDFAADKNGSVTLQIDEYHPVGAVSTTYESWTALGDQVERPMLDAQLAEQLATSLQIPKEGLLSQLGTPVAIGFLPNYKARLYDDGALAAYVDTPYVDVSLSHLSAATKRYKGTYYPHYPIRPDTDTQKQLDNGYKHALKRSKGPPDCDRESCIALTFDDGPDAIITPTVLNMLADEDIEATFFVQGNQVVRSPALIKQMVEAGHEVENHTFAHPDLVKLHKPELIKKQIDDTQAVLAANGVQAKFLRPPYGSIDETVKKTANMPLILWNVDAQEWRPGMTPQAMADSIVSQTRPGSIILMHDTRQISADALPYVISQLKARGFRFMTVAELLKIDGSARGVFASR